MTTFHGLPRRRLAGIPIVVASRNEAIDQIASVAQSGGAGDIHLANSYVVSLAFQDPEYRELLTGSAAVYPDGKPLVWMSRFLPGRPLSQVRGPSLFPDMMDLGRARGLRHYLLGNTDQVLAELRAELERRYPGVDIVGAHKSYFRPLTPDELAAQDADILASGADIVWVGLGTPLQDRETRRIARDLGKVAIGVGVAFDFVAGSKPSAPEWMTRLGVEWVFRLGSEPRRLWRRYLFGNLIFLRAVLGPEPRRQQEQSA